MSYPPGVTQRDIDEAAGGLERLATEAAVLAGGDHPCAILGHVWVFDGGAWCGCKDGDCSVSVHRCRVCGDYDYGDNEEADAMRAKCGQMRNSPCREGDCGNEEAGG